MNDEGGLRVLYTGAIMEPGWTGGEPVFADLLLRGLEKLGVDVVGEGSRRSFTELASLAFTPYDAEPTRIAHNRRRLRALQPDVVLVGFDFDCSWIIAAHKERIPVIICVHIYWPTCPIGTRYIEGVGICTSPGLVKCLRHISRAEMSPNLGLQFSPIPAPLALVLYSKMRLRPAALSKADAIVANSEFGGQVLTQAGYQNVHVIHNGIDTDLFRPRPWKGPSKLVLYPVARSRQERKGYHHFVQMAHAVHTQLPEVRFRMLNDPGNDFIEGTPHLSLSDLIEQLQSAYLAVVPGLWDEPFGLVAAEAMAVGRPVVMYDGGGSSELINDGKSGVLVPRGNVEELTRAVLRLLTDEEAAARIGQAARARVETTFQYSQTAARFLGLIRQVLSDHGTPRRRNVESGDRAA